VIERLIAGAKEMETSNRKLEARLSASREEIEQLQQNLETVRTESLTDPLTTLANRKFFDAELDRTVAEAKAGYEPLALLMCDVDHFKAFNDRFGHLTGDQVLRLVAISVKQIGRGEDMPRGTAARNSPSRCRRRRCAPRSASPIRSGAR